MRIRGLATLPLLAAAGAGPVAGQPTETVAADFERSGLELVLRSNGGDATDARVARLAALYVAEGEPPSPFLDPGSFEATFRGAIELDLNDSFHFAVRGHGGVRLSIGGQVVLEHDALPGGGTPAATADEVRLSKGPNPIELVYSSPARGDSWVRLTWGNDYLPEEPVPPASLRHGVSTALDRGRSRRAARDLVAGDAVSLARVVPAEYAERRIRRDGCLVCHSRDGAPASGPPAPDAGPTHAPPDLTWAGEKFRGDWLADYLAGHPADLPRPHPGVQTPASRGETDLFAVGLHHQHGLAASPPEPEPVDAELAAVGSDLIRGDRLGCHACHALGDEPALGGEGAEEAINFDLVRRRLRRPFFDWFLRDPQRILPGTKMPQFVDEDGYTGLYDVFDGEAARQFEAIWHYLDTID
ncbi:MAG: PA14 domain-containing protein [Acidobacteriota bacterium]|nr:PA14 domain-containing protein [Acidobacteriota bacterium]